MKGRTGKVTLASLSAAGLAVTGSVALAGPANASTGKNIDYYPAGWYNCYEHSASDFYCLWYHPGLTGGVWGTTSSYVKCLDPGGGASGCITADFTAGDGEVRNNAASMADDTSNCHVTTWVSPGRVGDWNWLYSSWGGNLTSTSSLPLRNNEASIDYDTCI
jgi:hypothetical protein